MLGVCRSLESTLVFLGTADFKWRCTKWDPFLSYCLVYIRPFNNIIVYGGILLGCRWVCWSFPLFDLFSAGTLNLLQIFKLVVNIQAKRVVNFSIVQYFYVCGIICYKLCSSRFFISSIVIIIIFSIMFNYYYCIFNYLLLCLHHYIY